MRREVARGVGRGCEEGDDLILGWSCFTGDAKLEGATTHLVLRQRIRGVLPQVFDRYRSPAQ